MPHHPMRLLAFVLGLAPPGAAAQIVRDSGAATPIESAASGSMDVQSAVRAQAEFEAFRTAALIALNFGPATMAKCDERIGGTWCYHDDEHKRAPPAEPAAIRGRREQLIATLDTVAMHAPGNRWAAEQRVRYLTEAGRPDSALAAARECRADGWACDVLVGFSLHVLGRYPAADSAYGRALSKMLPTERCDWRNVDLLIDDDTRQQYQRLPCGDPRRAAFEDRIWYFARTLYSLDGNDSRTEHYARKTMEMMYRDAPPLSIFRDAASAVAQIDDMETGISDEDLIEVMLRFGWPRAWVVNRSYPMGAGGRGRRQRESASGTGRRIPPIAMFRRGSCSTVQRRRIRRTGGCSSLPSLRATRRRTRSR